MSGSRYFHQTLPIACFVQSSVLPVLRSRTYCFRRPRTWCVLGRAVCSLLAVYRIKPVFQSRRRSGEFGGWSTQNLASNDQNLLLCLILPTLAAMKPKVYIETSIPSFYFETRANAAAIARREWTQEWWRTKGHLYEIFSSDAAYGELLLTPEPKRSQCLEFIEPIELLGVEP